MFEQLHAASLAKDDFLTKLFFCGETSDDIALKHLQEHRVSLLKQLEQMEWARPPTRRAVHACSNTRCWCATTRKLPCAPDWK
ncbi:MAG: hypothetical protein H0W02_17290 [Ktedonobacteraceae bacterium]|nr:hypothetical protein [Ktedonobacteraceae bacterium]